MTTMCQIFKRNERVVDELEAAEGDTSEKSSAKLLWSEFGGETGVVRHFVLEGWSRAIMCRILRGIRCGTRVDLLETPERPKTAATPARVALMEERFAEYPSAGAVTVLVLPDSLSRSTWISHLIPRRI